MSNELKIINKVKRMRIQSWRRGTKEMDLILGKFADGELQNLTESELNTYDEILNIDDHLLFSWVSGKKIVPKKFNGLMKKISMFRP